MMKITTIKEIYLCQIFYRVTFSHFALVSYKNKYENTVIRLNKVLKIKLPHTALEIQPLFKTMPIITVVY